ncbi:hypothetical protein CsSME_00037713 [Camellia sinensis var. sinensis]
MDNALHTVSDLLNADGGYLFRDWECHLAATTSLETDSSNFHTTDSNTNGSFLKNETFYLSPLLNGAVADSALDSVAGRDGGDACSISRMEDLVVRMDLTDDLLHMVFSFLKHIDLCMAAMVCRQWRAASVHEDFWRFLNFENRNICVQQYLILERLPFRVDLPLALWCLLLASVWSRPEGSTGARVYPLIGLLWV